MITPHKGAGQGAVKGVKHPYIRLTVAPSKARAGTRTRFRFRAFTLSGGRRRPLAAAHVWFAHRRATTNRRGAASITVRLRAGRATAKASRRGYVSGGAAVRVR